MGLITLEDILEQVVGRIEEAYPHQAEIALHDAVSAGGGVLSLSGDTHEQVVRELAAAIPPGRGPDGARIAETALARESEMSTDLDVGVAIPHGRLPELREPRVVFGRSDRGSCSRRAAS